jgi:hypothetical protein
MTEFPFLATDALPLVLNRFRRGLLRCVGLVEYYNFAEDHNSVPAFLLELCRLTVNAHFIFTVFRVFRPFTTQWSRPSRIPLCVIDDALQLC